jgi:hypothetical protein
VAEEKEAAESTTETESDDGEPAVGTQSKKTPASNSDDYQRHSPPPSQRSHDARETANTRTKSPSPSRSHVVSTGVARPKPDSDSSQQSVVRRPVKKAKPAVSSESDGDSDNSGVRAPQASGSRGAAASRRGARQPLKRGAKRF